MIRVFWKIVNIVPGNPVPNNFQKIYRTPQGVLYSDSVAYNFSINSKRDPDDQEIAWIDILKTNPGDENPMDPMMDLADYNIIQIDELAEDREISNSITQQLDLDYKNGVHPYIANYTVPENNNRFRRQVPLIQEDLIPRYSVWCDLHNKLMISASTKSDKVFPVYMIVGNLGQFYCYPLKVANTWRKKWSVVSTINDQISTVRSYSSYDAAEKAVKKYVKTKFNNNRRLVNFPDLKRNPFIRDIENGIGGNDRLEIKLYKEEELDSLVIQEGLPLIFSVNRGFQRWVIFLNGT